jgi:hypothetical protein
MGSNVVVSERIDAGAPRPGPTVRRKTLFYDRSGLLRTSRKHLAVKEEWKLVVRDGAPINSSSAVIFLLRAVVSDRWKIVVGCDRYPVSPSNYIGVLDRA